VTTLPLSEGDITAFEYRFELPQNWFPGGDEQLAPLLRLSQICRQLRAETKLLIYTLNTFHVELEHIRGFIDALQDHARDVIKELEVGTTPIRN
jgi:hypothetical protein